MDWSKKDQEIYDGIVHNLRSRGWTKEDAMEEADIKTAKMKERQEDEASQAPRV